MTKVLLNMPMAAGAPLSVMGLNFGLSDFTASASVGSSSCSTVGWVSSTFLTCSAGMPTDLARAAVIMHARTHTISLARTRMHARTSQFVALHSVVPLLEVG